MRGWNWKRVGQWSAMAAAAGALVCFIESGNPSKALRGLSAIPAADAQAISLSGIVDLPQDRLDLSTPTGSWLGSTTSGSSSGGQLGYYPWRGADISQNTYSTSMFLIKPDEILTTGDLGGFAWQYTSNTQGGGSADVTSRPIAYKAFVRIGRARPGWSELVPAFELNFDDDFRAEYILKNRAMPPPSNGAAPAGQAWGDIVHNAGMTFGFQSVNFTYLIPDTNVPYVMQIITGGSDPSPLQSDSVANNVYVGNQNGYTRTSAAAPPEFVDAGGWELNTTSTNRKHWAYAASIGSDFPPSQGTISPDRYPTLRLLFQQKVVSSSGRKMHGAGGGSCFIGSADQTPVVRETDSFGGLTSRFRLTDRAGAGRLPLFVSGGSAGQGLSEMLRQEGVLGVLSGAYRAAAEFPGAEGIALGLSGAGIVALLMTIFMGRARR